MIRIQALRRIHFCAGHRLLEHGGKCENLHGHNYVADVYVTASEVDSVGRVVDFAEIKRVFKGWIDDHWDHGFILCDRDHTAIQAVRSVSPHKLYLMSHNPTAENIARHLLEVVSPKLLDAFPGHSLRVARVSIWETKETCADVSCMDELNKE